MEAETDPEGPGAAGPGMLEACPACGGDAAARVACAVCGGLGSVAIADPRDLPDEAPEWFRCTAEVLYARAMIAQYGVDGWRRLEGVEPSACLAEALGIIDRELARLDHEHRKEWAVVERSRRRDAR